MLEEAATVLRAFIVKAQFAINRIAANDVEPAFNAVEELQGMILPEQLLASLVARKLGER